MLLQANKRLALQLDGSRGGGCRIASSYANPAKACGKGVPPKRSKVAAHTTILALENVDVHAWTLVERGVRLAVFDF